MRWLSANRHLFTLFEFSASDEHFRPVLRRGQDVAVADVVRHVKDAIVAGQIADADPLIITHSILGVTNQLARNFVLYRGMDPEEVADAAVRFCLEGLGVQHGLGGQPTGRPERVQPASRAERVQPAGRRERVQTAELEANGDG
jgi:hypothetical protein